MERLTDARILVVDDQPANVRLLERMLRQAGYENLRALTDPAAAVAAFREYAPDLVLLDLIMKPVGGLEILARLGELIAPGVYLPVLVLTADDSAETRHRALAAGAKDFLTKPLDPLEVALRIRNLLETRRLYLQLQAKTDHLEDEVRLRTRRLAEQARLIDLASDALIARDLDDRILYWNHGAERLFGWAAAEVVGRQATELLFRDPAQEREVSASLAERGEWVGELRKARKDGSEVVVHGRHTLVRDEDGKPFARFSVNSDLTRLKSLEWQLQRAQRLESVGALASGVAHDLNNMLTPIVMGIGLLGRCVEDELGKSLLETMSLSADCGRGLVRQLLTFVRGGGDSRGAELHLPSILGEVVSLLRKTFPRTIEIRYEAEAGLRPVGIDPTRLYQVVMNLCINARDAMPKGGELTLTAAAATLGPADLEGHAGAEPGDYVRLRVADSGVGMSPDTLAKVFDPFFTTKPDGTGTGLGLSTTAAIVAERGGLVCATSEPGKGSTFDVYLPAVARARAEPAAAARGPQGKGECLLVVDDEASIREVMRTTLQASGYRVLAAGDGVAALSLLRNNPDVALLLSDVGMPVMDGKQTVAAALAERPGLPCVLVSGESFEALGPVPGVRGRLVKPFSAADLLALLRRVLEGEANE